MALSLPITAAILLYAALTGYQSLCLKRQAKPFMPLLLAGGLIALLAHTLTLRQMLFLHGGLNLDFFNTASLVMAAVICITLIATLFISVENLLVLLFPMAALTILLAQILPSGVVRPINESSGVLCHILLSILAYGLLTIAVLQALLLSLQNYQLRNKKLSGLTRSFPPLQTMETLLFGFLWCGWVALTASLISGWLSFDNLFAQHLVHKTFLGILAWLVFAVLLWGRYFAGWRGAKAVHWTYAGFSLLMLAFFGSKLILEYVVHR